jgi:hypothetical protein
MLHGTICFTERFQVEEMSSCHTSGLANGVNFEIPRAEFCELGGPFSLFDVPIQSSAGGSKGSTDLWDGMTLISEHPLSQCYFSIGLELSWSSAEASSRPGCR